MIRFKKRKIKITELLHLCLLQDRDVPSGHLTKRGPRAMHTGKKLQN
jgi:hypothetical protein